MALPSASISDGFGICLCELESIAELRRNLAHTSNTSNAPVLSALISEKVKSLKHFFDKGHYSRIDQNETDRIVELIVTFGKGYDASGGLEYAIYQGLDHMLLGIIRLWTLNAAVNTSRTLGAMRAKLSAGPATSAAQNLDVLFGISLVRELGEAEAMNKDLIADEFQPQQS